MRELGRGCAKPTTALALLRGLRTSQPVVLVSLKQLGQTLEEPVTLHWANNTGFETESEAALTEYTTAVSLIGH